MRNVDLDIAQKSTSSDAAVAKVANHASRVSMINVGWSTWEDKSRNLNGMVRI